MLELRGAELNFIAAQREAGEAPKVDLALRDAELAVLLGAANSGRRELLRVLGGLETCGEGELVCGGLTTREYRSADWDAYRSHRVGWLLDGHELLSQLTVLENIELVMKTAGMPRAQRRRRATELLRRVGLGGEGNKRSEKLTLLQRRRAALARIIANDPDVILAEEPTAGLNTAESARLMDLLAAIARDRLVVVSTDEETAAERSEARVIRMAEGRITEDSRPCTEAAEVKKDKRRRPALGTAARQLAHRARRRSLGRTVLAALLGAVGIAAASLLLCAAKTAGERTAQVQSDLLAARPLVITDAIPNAETMMTALTDRAAGGSRISPERELDTILNAAGSMFDRSGSLAAFRTWLQEQSPAGLWMLQSDYAVPLYIYASDTSERLTQVSPSTPLDTLLDATALPVWVELWPDETVLENSFTLVAGRLPAAYNELVLFVDENNRLSDVYLRALALADSAGEEEGWNYETLLAVTYRLLLPTDFYRHGADGVWSYIGGDEDLMKNAVRSGVTLHVVGILRAREDTVALPGAMGYTPALTEYVIDSVLASDVVAEQLARPDTDVFTAKPFTARPETLTLSTAEKAAAFNAYYASLPAREQDNLYAAIAEARTEEELAALYDAYIAGNVSTSTLEDNLKRLGVVDREKPVALRLYADSLAGREALADAVREYDRQMLVTGRGNLAVAWEDTAPAAPGELLAPLQTGQTAARISAGAILLLSCLYAGSLAALSGHERRRDAVLLRLMGFPARSVAGTLRLEILLNALCAALPGAIVAVLLESLAGEKLGRLIGLGGLCSPDWLVTAVPVAAGLALLLIAGLVAAAGHTRRDPLREA